MSSCWAASLESASILRLAPIPDGAVNLRMLRRTPAEFRTYQDGIMPAGPGAREADSDMRRIVNQPLIVDKPLERVAHPLTPQVIIA
jgi:hypothetical protein